MMALAASCLRGRSAVFAIRSFVRCHQRRVRRSRRLREVGRQRRRWLLASVFILARCGGSGVSGPRRHDEVRTVLQALHSWVWGEASRPAVMRSMRSL